jgi:hypothetical protein
MRLAVLAASSYTTCQKLPELPFSADTLDVLSQRLSEADAAYTVHAFRAERGLPEALEQVLARAGEPVEALLLYFSGYAVVNDERGPALLLDGERLGTLSFKRLRRVLDEYVQSAVIVLDTLSAFDAETGAQEAAGILAAALEPGATSVHVLVGHRESGAAAERSPFTNLFELVLDWQSARTTPLGVDDLVRALQAEETLFAALPSFAYTPGPATFAVLGGGRPQSLAPEAPPPSDPVGVDATRVSAEERARALETSVTAEVEGDLARALAAARLALRGDPRDTSTLEWVLTLLERAGKSEAVWNATAALDLWGAASEVQREFVAAHRPEGLLAAKGVVSEGDWLEHLLLPERDAATERIVRALGDAAVSVGLETAQRKRRFPALDPSTEHDAEKSTTTLARTLVWTARLLGLPRPRLYVLESVPGELALGDVPAPTVLASKTLASGRTLPELAFRWARVLVQFRPERRTLAHFSAPGELDALGRATAALTATGSPPKLDADAKLLVRGLRRHVRGPVLSNLAAAVGSNSPAELAARLSIWARQTALLGGRAGLLACGNLALAASVIERAPLPGASATEQLDDIVAYSVSDEYARLRERLGVSVR